MLPLLFSLLLACGETDTRSALEALSSASADERLTAQRWLASHLRGADFPLVAEAAASGGLEVRSRLASALGSDDRHLELAALLATDRQQVLRELGERAIGERIRHWSGGSDLAPARVQRTLEALTELGGGTFSAAVDEGDLESVLDRIARLAPAEVGREVGVVLDPHLFAEGAPVPPGELGDVPRVEGRFDLLLVTAAAFRGAGLEGFALDGPHPFLRIAARADLGVRRGDELLVRWCRELLEYPDRPRGEGAARALAGTLWPAAILWMEERWRVLGDQNALSGLLLAAGRGRVAPALATEGGVRALLGIADRALAAGDARGLGRAEEVMRALAAMAPLGADGSSLPAVVVEGWATSGTVARRLRLGALAGMGRAPQGFRASLLGWLAGSGAAAEPELALDTVLALAATASGRPPAGATLAPDVAAAVLESARSRQQAGAHLAALARLGVAPPEEWRDPARLPEAWGFALRQDVLEWWLAAAGGEAVAAAHLAAQVERRPGEPEARLGDRLAERVAAGEADLLGRVFSLARERLAGNGLELALDRLALLAGVLPPERRAPLFDSLPPAEDLSARDLYVLGALAALEGEQGERAREVLMEVARAAIARREGSELPWAEAVARAVRGLRRRGADGTATVTLARLSVGLRQEEHPLLGEIERDQWPPPPSQRVIPLEALDLRLAPSARER